MLVSQKDGKGPMVGEGCDGGRPAMHAMTEHVSLYSSGAPMFCTGAPMKQKGFLEKRKGLCLPALVSYLWTRKPTVNLSWVG